MESEVLKFWKGKQGKEYTGRNPQNPKEMDALYLKDYGITRSQMNTRFVGNLPRNIKILEVGCNIGVQLQMLYDMGFHNLTGIDVQPIQKAGCFAFKLAPAQLIPFKDKTFDLVFTSGLLIHIPPIELQDVMGEIHRVAKRWIWGFEYFYPELEEIEYHGQKGVLWKGNYAGLFRGNFSLHYVDWESYVYQGGPHKSMMYLLERS